MVNEKRIARVVGAGARQYLPGRSFSERAHLGEPPAPALGGAFDCLFQIDHFSNPATLFFECSRSRRFDRVGVDSV
jgi:hypothetical protein